MSRGVAARVEAAEILSLVLDDGGFSNVLLARRTDLPERDRAHRTALVYGVLRIVPWLDELLERVGGRKVSSLDAAVRAILRIGAYELTVRGEAPYAVVDTSVEAIRRLGVPRAAGLVNAVLRKVAREAVAAPGAGVGVPSWIIEELTATYGADDLAAFLAASDHAARIGIRHRGTAPEGVLGIPAASYVDGTGALEPGSFDVIDPASTAVAQAVGAEPGMRVLDIGAAPGGKTAALADAMDGGELLVALDAHPRRIRRMRGRMRAMGVSPALVVGDGRTPPFAPASFDRVLLDAPCTGLGTLRRRPEIRYRLAPTSPAELGALQAAMLEAALRLVRPGGRLVYSVCTVFAAETIDVVAGRGARPPDGLPGRTEGDGLLLAPHLTQTDGMFIAVFDR